MALDYYKILGVSRNASDAEIKKQYRRLARKYHPDVSKLKDAEARFKEINEAYEVLKNKEKRKNYDQFGHPDGNPFQSGFHTGAGSAGQAGAQSWSSSDFGGFGQGSFSDIFERMFNQGARKQHNRQGGFNQGHHLNFTTGANARSSKQTGSDETQQIVNISVSLEDAYQGAEKSFRINIPGHKQAKRLKVKIPAGIKEGQKIRLSGQGGHGQDLYLKVKYKPHPLFQVKGNDIYLDLPVTVWEAALGEKISVPTLSQPVGLKIPPGSQSGKKLRLKNRGLGKPAGDLYVNLQIKLDPQPDANMLKLYQQMKKISHFNPRSHFS